MSSTAQRRKGQRQFDERLVQRRNEGWVGYGLLFHNRRPPLPFAPWLNQSRGMIAPLVQSPEPRAQSPEPRAQSPEPRVQSPLALGSSMRESITNSIHARICRFPNFFFLLKQRQLAPTWLARANTAGDSPTASHCPSVAGSHALWRVSAGVFVVVCCLFVLCPSRCRGVAVSRCPQRVGSLFVCRSVSYVVALLCRSLCRSLRCCVDGGVRDTLFVARRCWWWGSAVGVVAGGSLVVVVLGFGKLVGGCFLVVVVVVRWLLFGWFVGRCRVGGRCFCAVWVCSEKKWLK